MHSIVFNLFLLFVVLPIVAGAQEKPIIESGLARATSNDVRVGVNFGKQFGGGAILTPSGVIVTCKHVIAGFNEGRIELSTGKQVEFAVLKEVEGKDLVFLITKTPLLGTPIAYRENSTLQEGEELVCRASVSQGPLCTIRGSLAYSPRQASSGVLVAQMPLSPGASGTGLFDLNGNFAGVCIGPVSEKETSFVRAWSGDVVREAIRSSFADAWKDYAPEIVLDLLTVRENQGDLELQIGDKIDSVNSVAMNSETDLFLTTAALSARREKRAIFGVDRKGKKVQVVVEHHAPKPAANADGSQ